MKSYTLNILKTIGGLCLTVFVVSCSSEQKKAEDNKPVTVAVQPIAYTTNIFSDEYIGVVESESQLDISFLTMGNIGKMYVNEGQKVSKGQLLASLDKTTLQNSYQLTISTLRQAEDAFKRMTALYESNSLPEIQFIEAKTKLEQAKAMEAIARKSLDDGSIYAPKSGVIGKKYLEQGASVMPTTPVYQLLDVNTVKVKVAIPEGEISSIKIDKDCDVKISALADQLFTGKIIEKSVVANPVSHTYDIRIQIDNSNGAIMPGMVCRAYFNSTTQNGNEIVVPVKAVQVDFQDKRFVWLKSKDNKATYREVHLGKLVNNGVVINTGLNVGDELIIEGYHNVSEGVSVSIYNK